jgi:hypothetical protein
MANTAPVKCKTARGGGGRQGGRGKVSPKKPSKAKPAKTTGKTSGKKKVVHKKVKKQVRHKKVVKHQGRSCGGNSKPRTGPAKNR